MMFKSERPNCTPCAHCGRCEGCGISMVLNRRATWEQACPICRRYANNGMTRTPSKAFFDAIASGALLLRRKGLSIVAQEQAS